MVKKYGDVYKSSNGKNVRVVFLPKTNKANATFAWTVLGKKKQWFSKKANAIKYAKK